MAIALMPRLRAVGPFLRTRLFRSICKGVIAYVVAFVLIFLRGFDALNPYPITFSATVVLVAIAGQPGKSSGAVIDQGIVGMGGVAIGSLGFVILAKLGHSQVAQGFVFFIMVYLFALIKAQSMRFFVFALLGIIVSFSGIYTSILLDGAFVPAYLQAYVTGYLWGFAIVFFVCLAVWPVSSERELRELLVSSLEHCSTLSHLIAKTYTLEITEEEKIVRDTLNQSIRQDFGFLQQKLAETGLEINWTKWSMADYSRFIGRVRGIQQGLITSYSSLIALERFDPSALALIKHELKGTGLAFAKLRRGVDLIIGDLVGTLAPGKKKDEAYHSPAGEYSWDDFRDAQFDDDDSSRDTSPERRPSNTAGDSNTKGFLPRARTKSVSQSVYDDSEAVQGRLREVAERLKQEVRDADTEDGPGSPRLDGPSQFIPLQGVESVSTSTAVNTPFPGVTSQDGRRVVIHDKVLWFRETWKQFEEAQHESIGRILSGGWVSDETLHIERPGPSLQELYASNQPTWRDVNNHMNNKARARRRKATNPPAPESPQEKGQVPDLEDPKATLVKDDNASILDEGPEQTCTGTIMRVFSFLFGAGAVVNELSELHIDIVSSSEKAPRKKRLHLHFLEKVKKIKFDPGMPLPAALALLHGHDYTAPKITLAERVVQLEKLARSNSSIFAAKTATAVSVFAVFMLAPSLKSFFVSYGLTGGLITIVVAMAPTLGQTLLTFVLQILGTGFGTLYGLLLLTIFHNVGGWKFNPYGMTALLVPYAFALCWLIYARPMYFAGALLAMNGTGVLIVTEWVYNEVPGSIRPGFDSPAYRTGKALTAMAIALGIAGVFQVFILRRPARGTLRIQLSKLTFALSSYNILLQELTSAVAPMSLELPKDRKPPSGEAVDAVRKELMRRETQLQMHLLSLMPLMKFASAEPDFGTPFQGAIIARIIRNHQIILDRLREARTALGERGFSDEVYARITHKLYPYRRQAKRFSRALFYLCASSIATKTALPPELPSTLTTARGLQHDALVLSHRFTKTDEGRALLKSEAFLRCWFYLLSMTSTSYHLEQIEEDLRKLYGHSDNCPEYH